MNIEYAKKIINDNYMIRHHFVYKGARNQIDEFDGRIIKIFPVVFIVELDNGSIRAFNYSDIITNSLKIET